MYHLSNAYKTATRFSEILSTHCDRFHIAGSIRRQKRDVKDIEIVCQPKREFYQTGLFPGEGDYLVSKDFTEGLATITEKVIKVHIGGRYMKILTRSKICPGIMLDLFMPTAEDYYRQLAIRTGSREYVHNVLASAWIRKGWCGVEQHGLRLISDCVKVETGNGKYHWKLVNADGERPPAWQSEEVFFQWVGLNWISPELREFHHVINERQ